MDAKNTVRLGRRAMLAATLGGVAAAAGALAAPARVLGADGDELRIGQPNLGTRRTSLACGEGDIGLLVSAAAGHGVQGMTDSAANRAGVNGVASAGGSAGVRGINTATDSAGALGVGGAGVRALQGTVGVALSVLGKAHFSRSGVATIPAGQRFVKVNISGLTDYSFALATLQQYRQNLWVQSITVSAGSAAIYIYVSQYAPSNTRVAWTVFDQIPT